MKVKFWTPVVRMSASMLLRSITSFAGSNPGHKVATVTEGEIGQNVRALTAMQNLLSETTDKIRFAGARRTQLRRFISVSQERCRRRPGFAGPTGGPRDDIRRWGAR